MARVEESVQTQFPAASSPPRRPRFWVPAVALAAFWCFTVAAEWMELAMGIRFVSRWLAYGLLLLTFLIWWLAARGISRRVRWSALAIVVVGAIVASLAADRTVAGFPLVMTASPYLFTGWAIWAWLSRNLPPRSALLGLSAIVAGIFGYFDLVRWDGMDGGQHPRMSWRWSATPEERFLATHETAETRASSQKPHDDSVSATTFAVTATDWPGFRGANRDGRVAGTRIRTDWSEHPPAALWRHRVGPAWSSMAIVGDWLFTQEQRGEDETVVCYDAISGRELWVHADHERFDEQLSGPGPRGTPTYSGGRLYTLGARGRMNCLDAATGRVIWNRQAADDSGAAVPPWGFSASPLVIDNLAVIFAGGSSERGLLAYRTDSGELAWSAAAGTTSYSSPQAITRYDKSQIVMISDTGLTGFAPASGSIAWHQSLGPVGFAMPIAQPQAIDGTTGLLIPAGAGVALYGWSPGDDGEALGRSWASSDLKPSLNDYVVHERTIYGFDDGIFCAIDLDTGKRRWKRGRYGHGQVLLLADQGLLLVMGEQGDVVLLAARPQRSEELGRYAAIAGKTWNHPALAGGRLYVRNAEEMACYDLAADPQ